MRLLAMVHGRRVALYVARYVIHLQGLNGVKGKYPSGDPSSPRPGKMVLVWPIDPRYESNGQKW